MPREQAIDMPALPVDADADQAALRQRLDELVTRFAAQNMQAMLDFDHLANDGLSESKGNLLWKEGSVSLLDRGPEVQIPLP